MDSSNPVFNNKTLRRVLTLDRTHTTTMTVTGTINKTGLLFLCLVAAAAVNWNLGATPLAGVLALVGGIGAFILCLVLNFNPPLAPRLAPVYAIGEGLTLGWISLRFDEIYPGIAFHAMVLTVACLGGMLALYRSRMITVNERFRAVISGALMAICVTYLIDLVLMMFGHSIPLIHQGGTYGIIFSLIVVGVAALTLLLDFDMVEQSARSGAPRYMEWYSGFAMMVSLVWLYLEILRLLSKLNSRR